ncbi:MAG: cytochrome ubiquinol oxidase subunit I [Dysgonomonas mossii]|uniref:Cytochrome ubiquinol oxidase subunit I n=3 Tax=Dysgonomonas TaxID=156973 RepID=A0A4Y9IQK8_9BACT|nr:cytochrome ubiquinol oxidase subunit I [Dysgonomonas mossii]MBF0761337.1 cytochrome ubiquinol oxidase subunit I [Dysgonomonas mossii]MBS5797953.1 cytochrome ubiquinol oxidase subunit I [Dysgonomonas mossii]MBS7112485.1 cytochrome ubiquinol oxidase subunit I [Dysgonomonas mossii]TFU90288.1 cytochrome ubiquinol oxidase subunit I [Dysgonomonas mossii]SBV91940.1 Cytochrome bd ubiquinol oxidase subunit 1 [uncultured Dysgonomonas sp.]
MELLNASLIDWSRGQFAMTAMYHWLFVPLTLGLGVIMAIMETMYVRTGNEQWKKTAKFWMTIFGINFAIGVATGIIMEFQFGTNWSNYSWFVGDIFGAPLAIEAIVAFFMEATFISIMFFGWKRVSKKVHLAATWLTITGATLSAVWILVANAWMQFPVGMEFNPDTTRNEMVDFWAVALSPVAINKFFHTVLSSWILGAVFVMGIAAWYMLKKRDTEFAQQSMKVATVFGLIASLLTIYTGHGSAVQVAEKQPMKLAVMEGLYEGGTNEGLVLFGIPNPSKKSFNDGEDAFLFPPIKLPGALSLIAFYDTEAYVPGIKDIIDGGYPKPDGTTALSFAEMQSKGKAAIQALADYKKAKKDGDDASAVQYKETLKANFAYFGYGYLDSPEQLVPNLSKTVYWSFHIMVYLGGYFILLFMVMTFFVYRRKDLEQKKWLLWICLWTIPLVYVASQAGWLVAEVGRQPWAIQDVLPLQAAVSAVSTQSVVITFCLFLALFTALLIAEIRIMLNQIKKGPAGSH